jgi:hypothetical protein
MTEFIACSKKFDTSKATFGPIMLVDTLAERVDDLSGWLSLLQ